MFLRFFKKTWWNYQQIMKNTDIFINHYFAGIYFSFWCIKKKKLWFKGLKIYIERKSLLMWWHFRKQILTNFKGPNWNFTKLYIFVCFSFIFHQENINWFSLLLFWLKNFLHKTNNNLYSKNALNIVSQRFCFFNNRITDYIFFTVFRFKIFQSR